MQDMLLLVQKGHTDLQGEADRLQEEDKSLEALQILQLRGRPKKATVARVCR